jgi:hypothetical protein
MVFNHFSQFAVDPWRIRPDKYKSKLVIGQKDGLIETITKSDSFPWDVE